MFMTFQKLIKMAWTAIVLLMFLILADVKAQDFTKTECLSGKEETDIEIECPVNMKIAVEQAIYGRNKWESCKHTIGDCTENIDIFQSCQGQEKCSIQLNKTYSPKCGYATFLRVLFDCVSGTVTSSREYIPSPPTETRLSSPPVAIRDDSPSRTPDQVSNTEAGLIAGCVIAVIITTIMLLFAIYLVVKRLVKSPPGDFEKGPDGTPRPKPDIVIFDFCFCGSNSHPDKPRPVADQNQNIQNSAPLRISDRPVPIGEVTVANIDEFRHENEETITASVSNDTAYTVLDAASPSVIAEVQPHRTPRRHQQIPTDSANTAIGLPNTNSVTAC
ncbi:uncharacterized protein LOC126810809 isoform X2 [Patella vulgata]|uniref:uncharacterized protein LOC126810809 isoform X2 n=1 Tax=Patella vulgata TaxID=6465 RepID=UPI0021807746|nr:uncharacterized protein LOC126810809 isoform X2 [Patella vulgata]